MSVKLAICISDNKVWRPSFSACYTMALSLTWKSDAIKDEVREYSQRHQWPNIENPFKFI